MNIQFKSRYAPAGEYILYLRGYYNDGSPAIALSKENSGPQLTITVAQDDGPPRPGHIFVKDWSENEGVLDGLLEAGVIKPGIIRTIPSGYVEIYECPLTDEARTWLEDQV